MHTTVLITIKGPQRSVDLEVPEDIPISELLPTLLEICGPPPFHPALKNPTMWRLGPIESMHPLTEVSSLNDADVNDGAVLVLQNMEAWVNQNHRSTVDVLASIPPESGRPGIIWNKDGLIS